MNKKVLVTAMVVLGLLPSLLFAQLYRIEVDAQDSGGQKVIDRVFTGNTVGLQVSFFDGGSPLSMTNWNTRFLYGYGQYDTNSMIPIVGTAGATNNIVVFESATNVFFSENGNYYFSIVGTNEAGKVRTFARGRLIEEYDPATGGSYSNGIPMPWGNLNFASKEWIVEYIATNEFETVVSYGTNSTSAYRGEWGAAVSADVASVKSSISTGKVDTSLFAMEELARIGADAAISNTLSIYATGKLDSASASTTYQPAGSYATADGLVEVGAVASNAVPASATNGWEVGSHDGLVKTSHVGNIKIDGFLDVWRSSYSSDLSDGDNSFRVVNENSNNSEFVVDIRSGTQPWWHLETDTGYIVFTAGNDEAWLTSTHFFDEHERTKLNANLAADFIELIDEPENNTYKIYALGGNIIGNYSNENTSLLWTTDNGTNIWLGRVNNAESSRIAALAEGAGISAATATNIAQTVATSYGFAPTGSVQSLAATAASNAVGHGLADYYPVEYATSIAINPTNGYKQGLFLAGTSIVSVAGGATNQMGSVRLDVWTGVNQHLFTNPVPAGTWSTTAVNTVIYSKPAHATAWTARVFQW